MESVVSADLGPSVGSYNPGDEDESSGNWATVSRSGSSKPVHRVRPSTPRRDNLKQRGVSANTRYRNDIDRESLVKAHAELEQKLKLAVFRDQHLAKTNQENNTMRDNIEEELQRRFQLGQHQVTHVAQIAPSIMWRLRTLDDSLNPLQRQPSITLSDLLTHKWPAIWTSLLWNWNTPSPVKQLHQMKLDLPR
jgi:hypothetical protein